MSKLKDVLMRALKLAKQEEVTSRNTAIAKEIAAILNKHYKSRDTLLETQSMLRNTNQHKSKKPKVGVWGDYSKGEGKNLNKETSQVGKKIYQDVVDTNGSEDNDSPLDINFEELVNIPNQQLIDRFGNFNEVKNLCKELGLELDYSAEPEDFLDSMKNTIKSIISTYDEEE